MCGRFAFYTPAEAVVRLFGARAEEDFPPRWNLAPTQDAPVVRLDADGERYFDALYWGLVPFWAKEKAIGNRMINARAETVAEKPAFRQAFRQRRCLVLADGFYEWRKTASGKQPWFIHRAGGEPFAMAGLWERWDKGGEPLDSCTIVTTRANDWMTRLHNRMPAILLGDAVDRWLDPEPPEAELVDLLEPVGDEALDAHEVSREVNNPGNEGAELVERLE